MRWRIAVASLLMLACGTPLLACSLSVMNPDDLVENEPTCSANGRFCAIERRLDVPDFKSERAGKVYRRDPEFEGIEEATPSPRIIVALYEMTASRHLIGEFEVDRSIDRIYVSDSGRYVVATRRLYPGSCSGWRKPDDNVVEVYRSDGTRVGALKALDVVVESDLRPWIAEGVELSLRQESDTRDVLLFSFTVRKTTKERRVDLDTATLIDAKDPIYPSPHVYATPASASVVETSVGAFPRDCAAASMSVDEKELSAALVDAPLPQYPEIANRAHITTTLPVEVIVDERGDVVCARAKSFPFGISDAATAALRQWRFRPFRVDGHAVKAAAAFSFHFTNLDEAEWRDKVLPPFRVSDSR